MARRFDEGADQFALLPLAQSAARLRRRRSPETASTMSWQREGLGRCDADLGPGIGTHDEFASRAIVDSGTLGMARVCWPCSLQYAQRGKRIGRLARLRYQNGKPVLGQRRFAVAEFRGDIDFDGKPGDALEPVFGDKAGDVGGAAGGDGDAVERGEIERQLLRQARPALGEIDIFGERVADHLGLLGNLLGHEMLVLALVDQQGGGLREAVIAARPRRRRIENFDRIAAR